MKLVPISASENSINYGKGDESRIRILGEILNATTNTNTTSSNNSNKTNTTAANSTTDKKGDKVYSIESIPFNASIDTSKGHSNGSNTTVSNSSKSYEVYSIFYV